MRPLIGEDVPAGRVPTQNTPKVVSEPDTVPLRSHKSGVMIREKRSSIKIKKI
jgi:hypothetical protein